MSSGEWDALRDEGRGWANVAEVGCSVSTIFSGEGRSLLAGRYSPVVPSKFNQGGAAAGVQHQSRVYTPAQTQRWKDEYGHW